MTLPDSQLICTRPFEWCEIHPDGSVFLCCPTWLKRPVGNLLQQDIEEIWNGAVAREIRKSILNHGFHNCNSKHCPFLTTQSEPVGPLNAVENKKIRAAIEKRLSLLDFRPSRLNLCFDHSCNLACPSCRPHRRQATGEELKRCEAITERIIDQLLPQAEEVTLSGFGDPFGSPTYMSLLRHMNNLSQPPALRLHSNGQLWTEKLWNSLSGLHGSVREAEISIDAATAETYTLNRPGGSFERLLDNLNYLAEQPFPLTISMVVQANNYREMPAFVELAERFGASAYFSKLVNWGTFTREEFLQRAVHLEEHPRHENFRSVLTQVAALDKVRMGNLSPFLSP